MPRANISELPQKPPPTSISWSRRASTSSESTMSRRAGSSTSAPNAATLGNEKQFPKNYRAHYHSMEVQLEFTNRSIPFSITSRLRFFEQAHIKDVAAFLKFTANPRDEMSFKRIVRLTPRHRQQNRRHALGARPDASRRVHRLRPPRRNQGSRPRPKKITLSTLHQAKGLEWRVVFLVWLADGMFPSRFLREIPESLVNPSPYGKSRSEPHSADDESF